MVIEQVAIGDAPKYILGVREGRRSGVAPRTQAEGIGCGGGPKGVQCDPVRFRRLDVEASERGRAGLDEVRTSTCRDARDRNAFEVVLRSRDVPEPAAPTDPLTYARGKIPSMRPKPGVPKRGRGTNPWRPNAVRSPPVVVSGRARQGGCRTGRPSDHAAPERRVRFQTAG